MPRRQCQKQCVYIVGNVVTSSSSSSSSSSTPATKMNEQGEHREKKQDEKPRHHATETGGKYTPSPFPPLFHLSTNYNKKNTRCTPVNQTIERSSLGSEALAVYEYVVSKQIKLSKTIKQAIDTKPATSQPTNHRTNEPNQSTNGCTSLINHDLPVDHLAPDVPL